MIAQRDDPLEDEQLFKRYQNGENNALEVLASKYTPPLLACLRRFVGDYAEDCLQETFLRIHEKKHQFDPDKSEVLTWFYVIARNVARDTLRKEKIRPFYGLTLNERLTGTSQDNSEEEISEIIEKDIKRLPPKYQDLINMVYFRGNSLRNISRSLNLPLGTVKRRLNLALAVLRKKMDKSVYQPAA